jgi:CubicO group peptidase (beta-lactamase class C family)
MSSSSALPRSSPESEGVDPSGIQVFLDTLESAPDIEMHSLMIIRHGQVAAEGWWSPYVPEQMHLLYSLSKSFTSTAAAFAVAEGLVDLDATVLSYFPELDREITDPRSRSMLVRHVAAMASGHLEETADRALALDPLEPVRGFLLIPPDREPGTVFAYNQPWTYSLAAIVQRLTGETLTAYLRPRLFDPLGIGRVGWQQYPAGRDIGYSGLHATTDAIARLGLLYLQGGVWDGQRLLSEEWVTEATRRQIETPERAKSGLAAGVRIPVLDVATWISRRRRVRAILLGASRTGCGDRDDCRNRQHAGHSGRGVDASAAGHDCHDAAAVAGRRAASCATCRPSTAATRGQACPRLLDVRLGRCLVPASGWTLRGSTNADWRPASPRS